MRWLKNNNVLLSLIVFISILILITVYYVIVNVPVIMFDKTR